MRTSILLFVIALMAGCASQPASTPAAATPPVLPPAVDVAKMAVLKSEPGAAAAPAAEPTATTKKVAVPAGYKAVERNGTTFYCVKVATLGTKFKQEFCMTQDEYDEVQRRGENVRQDLRQTTKMCAGGTGAFSCSGG